MASDKTKSADRIMKVLDMFQAFPLLVLAIVIVAMWGNNIRNVIFAIILINVPRFTRLIRSEALTVRESRFIEVATAMGASKTRIISRHLLTKYLRNFARTGFNNNRSFHSGRGSTELYWYRSRPTGSKLGLHD